MEVGAGRSTAAARSAQYSAGIVSSMRTIVKEEGLLALWKGNGTSMVHRFPYAAINFFTFETTLNTVSASLITLM